MAKGVRKNGNKFRWECCVHGKRLSGTENTEIEAVQARDRTIQSIIALSPEPTMKPTIAPNNSPTLQEAIDDLYKAEWGLCKSQCSLQSNIKAISNYFGKDIHINQITSALVASFIDTLRTKGDTNATINRKLSVISKILHRAERYEQIIKCPYIEHQKEAGHRIRYITEEEERQMLEWCKNRGDNRFYCIIVVLIDTGIRCGELMKLTQKDIIKQQGQHGVIRLDDTKNGLSRSVPLTRRAAVALRYLRITSSKNKHLITESYAQLRQIWLCMRYNLGYANDPDFVLHILRHTCCSRLVAKGAPIKKVQMWMGHLNILTTMRYTHLAPEELYDMTA